MTSGALEALFYPFEKDLLKPPANGEQVLVIGAQRDFRLPSHIAADLTVVQGFRADFLALQKAGFNVVAVAEGNGFDAAMVLLGRHRAENEARIAEALLRTRPGGAVVAAGMKKDGAGSLRKRLSVLLEIEGYAAKSHGVVFWLVRRDGGNAEAVIALSGRSASRADDFETAPGGFSHDGVDPGSRFLLDSLPGDLSGAVADFGAGWGYLAAGIAGKAGGISTIDLYEAHHASLEAARRNLARLAPGTQSRFFWHDLLSEPVTRRYDVIVMNPPFHHGRAAEPALGSAMIRSAAKALKPGGRLFMVANAPLPYEPVLTSAFAAHGEVARDARFKVLWGKR